MTANEPFADVADEPLLNIKAVSQATGIESVTLRAWERRYGVPMPNRTEQGYRLYSERDIAILNWLKTKVDEGVTIKRAVGLLHSQMPQRIDYINEEIQATLAASTADPDAAANFEDLVDALLQAVHAFDTVNAQEIIKQAFVLYPVEDVCLKLLLPVLAIIGEKWERGETSLQVEHFTTHMIRQQLLALGATMPSPWRAGRIVAGCAPEDWHEMGILMLSLFLRRRGWEVIFLGQAVGLDRLMEAMDAIQPDVLLLSSGYLDTSVNLLVAAEQTTEHLSDRIWFVYGGMLFDHAPELIGHIPGIYAGPTLLDARDRIDSLLSGTWSPEQGHAPEISTEKMAIYKALKTVELTLTDGLSGLILENQHGVKTSDATQAARHVIHALVAALRFDMPELQNTRANPARHRVAEADIPREKLDEMFRYYVGPNHMAHLSPYIDAMTTPS
jgi:methanogenic corrinoid protein MtbC1